MILAPRRSVPSDRKSSTGLPRLCCYLLSLLAVLLPAGSLWGASVPQRGAPVPLCRDVTLAASYLAQAGPEGLPGFQFVLANNTAAPIRLAKPVPSSSHWYALSDGRWLWRASNGTGGSLLNALNEHGRVFAYSGDPGKGVGKSILVEPHRTRTWIEDEQQNPVLAYNPGCPHCSYPGERDYRVVFGYAYLPETGDSGKAWLRCGLRSKPVPMPPKPKQH